MAARLHALAQRQLQRLQLTTDVAPTADRWAQFVERVARAYQDFEQERYLLQRSQELASAEMDGLNQALRTSQARLASLVSLSSDWVWEQDAQMRFSYVSDVTAGGQGPDLRSLLNTTLDDTERFMVDADVLTAYTSAVANNASFRDLTFGTMQADGREFHFRLSGEPVFDLRGQRVGYRGVGSDVTRAVTAERQLKFMARFDGLTGLPNRAQFTERLSLAQARSQRSHLSFAVMFIDLDRFKAVNDGLGHAAGDELLRTIAARLRQQVRNTDLVARLGGDEFVVLLEDIEEPALLRKLAERLLASIGKPMTLAANQVQIGGSIGISVYPGDGEDADTLLKHADAAMYQAKHRGRNNFQFYAGQHESESVNQFALEAELRQAIARDEFQLVFQPKIRVSDGALAGLEALLRWKHPERGMVPPVDFIGLAEETGLIVPIGRWVMQATCRQMRAWHDAGLLIPQCSLNLSMRQFASESLVDDLRAALDAHGLPASVLEVEITESTLMTDAKRADRVMNRLHDMGIRISIDDFGTGYSSLAYLKRFPAQVLKIDRSFISDLPGDSDDAAITQAVIAMAHQLGLSVVAEGVETAEQLDFLRGLGCDEVQGYLMGRPMLSAALEERPDVKALQACACVPLAVAGTTPRATAVDASVATPASATV